MKTILKIEGLRLTRGGTVILDDVSWQVRDGEHWVILGSNGSGKTSLLGALAGYIPATAGKITVLGETFGESEWSELRKRIGIVSSTVRQMMADDEPALESVISGKYAMIDFWGKIVEADKKQARQILKQVECEYVEARPWRVLSQGERQRVLIGRALMAKPALLILDEPCAGLDPVAREHFLQFIQRLEKSADAPALVLVTHHVEEIMPVFTNVLLLKEGRSVTAGRVKDALTAEKLSEAFGAPVELKKENGRYQLVIAAVGNRVM